MTPKCKAVVDVRNDKTVVTCGKLAIAKYRGEWLCAAHHPKRKD